jgi:hypothetical protein
MHRVSQWWTDSEGTDLWNRKALQILCSCFSSFHIWKQMRSKSMETAFFLETEDKCIHCTPSMAEMSHYPGFCTAPVTWQGSFEVIVQAPLSIRVTLSGTAGKSSCSLNHNITIFSSRNSVGWICVKRPSLGNTHFFKSLHFINFLNIGAEGPL